MSVSRFLLMAVLLTSVALAYVHQQMELVKINYNINYNRDSLSVLLDQNSTLLYNVVGFHSPVYLEQILQAKEDSWEIPSSWYTIGLAEAAR